MSSEEKDSMLSSMIGTSGSSLKKMKKCFDELSKLIMSHPDKVSDAAFDQFRSIRKTLFDIESKSLDVCRKWNVLIFKLKQAGENVQINEGGESTKVKVDIDVDALIELADLGIRISEFCQKLEGQAEDTLYEIAKISSEHESVVLNLSEDVRSLLAAALTVASKIAVHVCNGYGVPILKEVTSKTYNWLVDTSNSKTWLEKYSNVKRSTNIVAAIEEFKSFFLDLRQCAVETKCAASGITDVAYFLKELGEELSHSDFMEYVGKLDEAVGWLKACALSSPPPSPRRKPECIVRPPGEIKILEGYMKERA